jgi:hypothetical protein
MLTITEASARTTAAPAALFERWGDMATWPEWNADTEWVRLDGPFATGSRGVLKPKGGPKVKFVIESLVPGQEFVDVSLLFGARLTFRHDVTPLPDGGCDVRVAVTMTGPLARVWAGILGSGFRKTLQTDLDRLIALVEAREPALAEA